MGNNEIINERMAQKPKAFCCWSGGKESCLALYKSLKILNVVYLVNMISEDGVYSRSHGVKAELLKLQAEAIGIPIIQRATTWENYEHEFKSVVLDLKKKDVNIGVFGDVDLQEHRDWVERVCNEIKIRPVLPLWNEDEEKLLKEFIDVGFKATVCAVNSKFLGKEWLGCKINGKFIKDLKSQGNVSFCGEHGEYHTFVYDGPIFKKTIKITTGKKTFKNGHWFLELEIFAES